jgi:plastocyanin
MTRPLIALVVTAAFAAGCGEEERGAGSPAPTPPTATPTASPAAAEAADAKGTVAIKGFAYSPARVTVRRGSKVTWANEDAANHTVTFSEEGPADVGNLREGRSATVTFDERGSYAYICEFHPGMAGTVEVR